MRIRGLERRQWAPAARWVRAAARLVVAGWLLVLGALGVLGAPAALATELPMPEDEAARIEGRVVIYAATDQSVVQPLIDDFEARHPGVRVDYHDMNSTVLYQRFRKESDAGASADVVWSSAMDLQIKLVNDGYAQAYASPESAALPSWARWRNEAFGTTFEPVVFAYNTRLLKGGDVPRTHAQLVRLLEAPDSPLRRRVATYDPTRSGLGYMLHSQDLRANPGGFWGLAGSLGRAQPRLVATTSEMLDALARGDVLLAYNTLGSYALARARRDAVIGVVLPEDYTLVVTRILFVARKALHPNAARLWVDYLLSERGQDILARRAGLLSVREDLDPQITAAGLRERLGGAFRPIALGSGLLAHLDQIQRRAFLDEWGARMTAH